MESRLKKPPHTPVLKLIKKSHHLHEGGAEGAATAFVLWPQGGATLAGTRRPRCALAGGVRAWRPHRPAGQRGSSRQEGGGPPGGVQGGFAPSAGLDGLGDTWAGNGQSQGGQETSRGGPGRRRTALGSGLQSCLSHTLNLGAPPPPSAAWPGGHRGRGDLLESGPRPIG